MPVKISKVAKDLNVGTQTIIDFLSKKNITVESNPNARISDEQHKMLLDAFRTDKDQRIKSDNFISERRQERAKPAQQPKQQRKSENFISTASQIPTPKIVGKIDLSQAGKPKQAIKPEPAAKPVPQEEITKQEEIVATPQEVETATETQPQAEGKNEQKQPGEPEKIEKVEEPNTAMDNGNNETEESEKKSEEEIFTLGTPTLKNQPKVIGKIDLSAINSQTRPKKKSKEEKRKERQEKMRQETSSPKNGNGDNSSATTGTGDRKKRKRIGKEKIDIEKSVNLLDSQQPKSGKSGNNAGNGDETSGKNRKNRKNKRPFKTEISDEDVQKQVKETLARLTAKTPKKSAKWRKEKREAVEEREREAAELEAQEEKTLKLTEFVTVNDLAVMMNVPINKVIGTCMSLGVMVSINQRLDAETINIVADEFGFKTEYVSAEVSEAIHHHDDEEDKPEDLVPRPPVVTVMGHVDHGKTSLLDYIRNANVIAGEAGGITQHIGAYNVKLKNGQHITFLDTPGHEAFTAMRARGAKITDIVIIIVAADDNVMPQTVEAINHASAAGVPIIFAINKIDKPAANPDKIKEELANMNYLVEEWGGKYQSQDISAKKGIGVTELLDKVLLEAEMLELKANPKRRATGSIIESSLDKGRGYVATVLVQNGTLKVGDILLAGTHYGKIKAMFNERNQRITEAGPSEPALILGLNGAPTAGDKFNVMDTDQEAREIASKREQLQRELGLRTQKRVTLEDIGRRKALGSFNELNIIVKGDVDGSIEALSDSLIKLSTPEVQVNVIHKAVGAISESDVTLAAASDAFIIGFQVRPSLAARRLAERDGVDIRLYSVIYKAIEEVKAAMEGLLSPEVKEEIIGSAEVMQTYHISKVGTIAGAIVREGKVKRNCKVRIIRDGIVIYTGELGSLKRFKDDVKEVTSGFDCGLSVAGYNDIKEGDFIESFEEVEVKKTL